MSKYYYESNVRIYYMYLYDHRVKLSFQRCVDRWKQRKLTRKY